ncbi:uncharacterized protein LOC134853937 [Symsagittifera roscoffensis]|uniref:uncharacterized protein LOC134853937 n=1 Tax=Symsagittifera roscoffensis TaxID=84072 RepID=UPI00307C5201
MEFVLNLNIPHKSVFGYLDCHILDSVTGKRIGSIMITNKDNDEDDGVLNYDLNRVISTKKYSAAARSSFSSDKTIEDMGIKRDKIRKYDEQSDSEYSQRSFQKEPPKCRRRKLGHCKVDLPSSRQEASKDNDNISVSSQSIETETDSVSSRFEHKIFTEESNCAKSYSSSNRSDTPPARTPRRKYGYPALQSVNASCSSKKKATESEKIGRKSSDRSTKSLDFENLTKDFHKLCGLRKRSPNSAEISPYCFCRDSHEFSCRYCMFSSTTESTMKRHISIHGSANYMPHKAKKSICKKHTYTRTTFKSSWKKSESSLS